jgi:uncharacterized protein YlzI (FlbEa/FlbD family)
MIHLQKPNGQTVAINPLQVLMITEGTAGCTIHFVGGVNTMTNESYLDVVAKIKVALEK